MIEPITVPGAGYLKTVIHRDPNKNEVSVIQWGPGALSFPHDHSVAEMTYVLEGCIFEVRQEGDGYRKRYFKKGDIFEVPAGTRHVVGVEKTHGNAVTVNVCDGPLSMNILQDFHPPNDVTA